jgi:hypothetical protein
MGLHRAGVDLDRVDLTKMPAELRAVRQQVEPAIMVLECIAVGAASVEADLRRGWRRSKGAG